MYITACIVVFLVAYLINTTTISVLYHRGLAHQAVQLSPRTRLWVARLGIWFTGLDAKGWVCMHRMHHAHSDTPLDPHSPVNHGLFGVLLGQLRSYEKTLRGLARNNPEYTQHVEDLDFPVSSIIRHGVWYLPYLLHLVFALLIAIPTGAWALAACYFVGMMSHPVEGWIVNSLGHAVGGRNFDTDDQSRNNHLAAWLIMGEGYQNNHHSHPRSAKFSYRRHEIDPGYFVCRVLEKLGWLEIDRASLIGTFPADENTATSFVQI